VGLVDVDGYWTGLRALLQHAVAEGFVRPEYARLLLIEATPPALLDRFAAWQPPTGAPVWLDASQT
jgi:predicted Rossmann-fold nucleotide-binding protein